MVTGRHRDQLEQTLHVLVLPALKLALASMTGCAGGPREEMYSCERGGVLKSRKRATSELVNRNFQFQDPLFPLLRIRSGSSEIGLENPPFQNISSSGSFCF